MTGVIVGSLRHLLCYGSMKITAVYIPGLFDKQKGLIFAQRQLLRSWRLYGIRTELFVVGWANEAESFDNRLKALLERIDELAKTGSEVVLVGASAGASTALAAFAKRKETVCAMISICGQLRGIKKVPDPALDINPRFRASLEAMEKSLTTLSSDDRQRILTLRPRVDAVVQPDEAVLDGAVNVQMPVVGHLFGIGFAIVGKGRRIARFVTKTAHEHRRS